MPAPIPRISKHGVCDIRERCCRAAGRWEIGSPQSSGPRNVEVDI